MTAFTEALNAALLHFVWQGFAVGILLWMTLLFLRSRPATHRYAAACAALALLALLPAVTTWVLYSRPAPVTAGTSSTALLVPVVTAGPATLSWLAAMQAWALPVWAFGVLVLSVRLVWSSRQVYSLRRRGEPATPKLLGLVENLAHRMRIHRHVRILVSTIADTPGVIGWLRPLILLPPAALLNFTPEQLESILAHELAHIKRFDYLVNLLQMLVETLLFYHPIVWWTSTRIRHERELCCDDLAVASCGNAVLYARALTMLERLRLGAPALALAATGNPLFYRIQRLIGRAPEQSGPSRLPGVLALLMGLACLSFNIHWAHAQTVDPEVRVLFDRINNQVKVDLGGATLLHRTPVEYPHAAIEKRIEGTVVIEATLDAKGNVIDARIISGPAELRKAALQSILEWHFAGGAEGASRVVNMDFRLSSVNPVEAVVKLKQELAQNQLQLVEEHTQQIQELKERLEQLRMERVNQQQAQISEQRNEALQIEKQLRDAEQMMLELQANERQLEEGTLKAIVVTGLSDQVRDDLIARLPVKIGDKLTPQLIERIREAVRNFDEHLDVNLLPCEAKGGTKVQISAPGSGQIFLIRDGPSREKIEQ